ncbi:N-acetylmuramoyl-L-alanine amidase [bacterium]|nr:N-acetylmuramoyl-L-alanine amidase [bacterium]
MKKHFLQTWVLVLAVLATAVVPAWAGGVKDVRLARHADDHVRCVVELDARPSFRIINASSDSETVTIEVSGVGSAPSQIEVAGELGLVIDNLLEFRPDGSVCYVHLRTAKPVRVVTDTIEDPWRLVVDLYEDDGKTPALPDWSAPRPQATPAPVAPTLPAGAFHPRVIVIDPGHGGKHRGGLGKINGRTISEAEVTLPIAQKLERLLAADPMFVPQLTRKSDVYVGLRERTRRAEHFSGDLFLSIHMNAVSGKSAAKTARGFELWTWSSKPADRAATKYLAELENEEGGGDLSNASDRAMPVLNQMMRDALEMQALESERAAKALETAFMRDSYFKSHYRGIKSARFKVLENYNMPSVLLEVGFITHPTEVRQLASSTFQDRVARHMYDAIVSYFQTTDPAFRTARASVASR